MAAREQADALHGNFADGGEAMEVAASGAGSVVAPPLLEHIGGMGEHARPEHSDGLIGQAPRLPRHIPSLDGLRAISIVFVIVAHSSGTRNAPKALEFLLPFGNLGVKVFFEISGFLITTLLLKELSTTGRVSLGGFYWRRVLRIFPAFYVYIGIICAMSALGVITLRPGDLLHSITFTMNYHDNRAWYLNHLWSLSVEEQFYLIWPALLYAAGVRRALSILLGVIVAAPLVRTAMVYPLGASATAMTRQFQAVADALAAGCLLAVCFNWLGHRRGYVTFLLSPLFFVVMLAGFLIPLKLYKIQPSLFYTIGQSISHLCIAVCIDRCVRFPGGWIGRTLNLRPLAFVGALSYSLYLWQEPFLIPSDQSHSRISAFPFNVGCAVLAALASYYVIERPILKLKNRWSAYTAPAVDLSRGGTA